MLSQGLEALKTGGIGAQIPIIARALESSKSQLSGDLQGTQDSLAQSRLAGTPFGQNILAQAKIAGNQGIANIPTSYAEQFISQLPGFVTSLTGQGMAGAGAAAGAQANIVGSRNQAYAQILSAAIPRTNFNFSAGTGGG